MAVTNWGTCVCPRNKARCKIETFEIALLRNHSSSSVFLRACLVVKNPRDAREETLTIFHQGLRSAELVCGFIRRNSRLECSRRLWAAYPAQLETCLTQGRASFDSSGMSDDEGTVFRENWGNFRVMLALISGFTGFGGFSYSFFERVFRIVRQIPSTLIYVKRG